MKNKNPYWACCFDGIIKTSKRALTHVEACIQCFGEHKSEMTCSPYPKNPRYMSLDDVQNLQRKLLTEHKNRRRSHA
jgi:hypothetical protein